MTILCIETTQIGLCTASVGTAKWRSSTETRSSDGLILAIDDLLLRSRVHLQEIDLIVCAVGPGNFTGIRSGIAITRGLSDALPGVMIGSLSSLEIVAFALCERFARFTAAIRPCGDKYRNLKSLGEVDAHTYQVPFDESSARFTAAIRSCGDEWYAQEFDRNLKPLGEVATCTYQVQFDDYPQPSSDLMMDAVLSGKFDFSMRGDLKPVYVRPALKA